MGSGMGTGSVGSESVCAVAIRQVIYSSVIQVDSFRVDADFLQAKKPTNLSRRRTNQLCYAVIQKEVRQYGAQRPSLDVAFTCERYCPE